MWIVELGFEPVQLPPESSVPCDAQVLSRQILRSPLIEGPNSISVLVILNSQFNNYKISTISEVCFVFFVLCFLLFRML